MTARSGGRRRPRATSRGRPRARPHDTRSGPTMITQELHDGWTLRAVGGPVPSEIAAAIVPAQVPGSVHTDLLAAGLIPDPYLDLHESALAWMHRADWRYELPLTAAAPAGDERV